MSIREVCTCSVDAKCPIGNNGPEQYCHIKTLLKHGYMLDEAGKPTKKQPISPDQHCSCDCGDSCPLGRMGMEERCTQRELVAKGFTLQAYIDVRHLDKDKVSHEVDVLTVRSGNRQTTVWYPPVTVMTGQQFSTLKWRPKPMVIDPNVGQVDPAINEIVEQFHRERFNQYKRYTHESDDAVGMTGWVAIITKYLGRIAQDKDLDYSYDALIKIGALCIAAAQAMRREFDRRRPRSREESLEELLAIIATTIGSDENSDWVMKQIASIQELGRDPREVHQMIAKRFPSIFAHVRKMVNQAEFNKPENRPQGQTQSPAQDAAQMATATLLSRPDFDREFDAMKVLLGLALRDGILQDVKKVLRKVADGQVAPYLALGDISRRFPNLLKT